MTCAASATISGLRARAMAGSPPSRFCTAAVAITVRGQSALTAMPFGRSSSARPSTHKLMPYLAMVYARCGANQRASRFNGGESIKMCGFELRSSAGMQALEHKKVPRVLT